MMAGQKRLITETFQIKNMVSNCCIILLREKLLEAGIIVNEIRLGWIVISYYPDQIGNSKIRQIVQEIGLDIIVSREEQLIEQIKIAIIELIHHMNNVDSIARKSDYLVEKLGYSYQYLSKTFSSHEPITLEKYIILQKIEKIKEMIDSQEFTLSEIAYMMDYSSVQYLSNQFKKITGVSVSDYKSGSRSIKKPLNELY